MMNICPVCGSEFIDECLICLTKLNQCILCYQEFESNDAAIQCLSCGYLGHLENMQSWLEEEKECPVCRINYKMELFIKLNTTTKTVRDAHKFRKRVYVERKEIFNEFGFRLPYYDFQSSLVDKIKEDFLHYNNILLISPPGSGKTIIGLSIARELSVNTLILTPNLAVLGSWLDRTDMFFEGNEIHMKAQEVIGRENGILNPLTITTYQRVNSEFRGFNKNKSTKKNTRKIELKSSPLSKYTIERSQPENLFDRLINHDIGLIILDEAHRLTKTWGKNILQLAEKLENIKILGLTATPPQKRDKNFGRIFTGKKYDIPLPLLVREKILAPYNDLVLMGPNIDRSSDVGLNEREAKNYFTTMKSTRINDLLANGYAETKLLESVGSTDEGSWLMKNHSFRLAMALEVIHQEMEFMGDNLRILIVLDQENVPASYFLKEKGMRGAIGVFENLVLDPVIDTLDPVLVTGKSLLVDDDFTDEFVEKGVHWAKYHNYNVNFRIKKLKGKKYSIINGVGVDWNTETYTRYVTHLFETGLTKCLVGTRFLLGEGWDSLSLNTIIDLTTVSTYASVNQLKGRALRKDPNNPDKVSNLYEIINNPKMNLITQNEFQIYQRRHVNYFGVDELGNIRNGINRLSPFISQNEINTDTLGFNEHTFQKAKDRKNVRSLWKVGEKLGNLYHVIRFGFRIEQKYKNYISKFENALKTLLTEYNRVINANFTWVVKSEIDFDRSIIPFYYYNIKLYAPYYVKNELVLDLKSQLSNDRETMGIVITVHFQPLPKFLYKIFNKIFPKREIGLKISYLFPLANQIHIDQTTADDFITIGSYTMNKGYITPYYSPVERNHLLEIETEYEYANFGMQADADTRYDFQSFKT